MTEEIKKLLQAKFQLEKEKQQCQDSKIFGIANEETSVLYTRIWEKIIKNADFSKEEASATWGIYNLENTTSKGRKEDFEMAKSYNARHKDDEIHFAVSEKQTYFVLSRLLISMLKADNVETRTYCGGAKNRWKFYIKTADLLNILDESKEEQKNNHIR